MPSLPGQNYLERNVFSSVCRVCDIRVKTGARFPIPEDEYSLKTNAMIAHCFFCSINYTVISKMETYSEDKDRFLKMVGIKQDIKEERLNVRGGESIQDKTRERH